MASQTIALAQQDAGDLVQSAFRNKLINGDMKVDQRQNGAAVTPSATGYLIDKWKLYMTQASKLTGQQNAGSVTPPAGFQSYLGITTATAFTPASTDQFALSQVVEANNLAGWAWGTSKAQPVCLQFQVYSSLTGTFAAALTNMAGTRSYPFTFSITSANTWTTINIKNIPGDTGGTWVLTGAVGGMLLQFNLGAGSNYQGATSTWQAGLYTSVSGAVNVVATLGATFYVTGVQLENGSVCTPYELLPIGLELSLCQRYYEKRANTGMYLSYGTGGMQSATVGFFNIPFTRKRAVPTVTYSGAATFTVWACGNNYALSSLANIGAGYDQVGLQATLSSSSTLGYAAALEDAGSGTSYIAIDADM